MGSSTILLETDPEVTHLTLNRPDVYNAIRFDELSDLSEILSSLEASPPRVVMLSGCSPGFCSGIDLKESREATASFARKRATLMHEVLYRLRSLSSIVITVIDGVAAGLGCELAISGDLRIGSLDSRFSYPEPKVAVPSPTFHLSQLIGVARTQDMLLTARWIDSGEALRWGLVHRVSVNPREESMQVARDLLALSPISLARTKENLKISIHQNRSDATKHHIEHVALAADTDDRKEALQAFAERRSPIFRGE